MDYLEQRGEKTDDPGKYKKDTRRSTSCIPSYPQREEKSTVIRGDRHRGGAGAFFNGTYQMPGVCV